MHDGPWNEFIVVIPMICFVMLEILILRQVKSLGVRETVVISLYILMPGVAGVLQVLNNAFEFGYAGSAIGLVFIYVMIQSRIIAHEKVKAEMYSSLSTIDVLTGIKNRRGYDEVLNGIGGKIEELVKTAEEKMYEDKSNYYKTTGKERRK